MSIKRYYNKFVSENISIIFYKLLNDTLALALLSFAVMLFADGILPGLITQHISLTRVIAVIFLLIGMIIFLGKKFQITYELPRIKKNRFLPILIIFVFLLIGNSLLKFELWENLVITITTIFIFFLFYELIFIEEKKS